MRNALWFFLILMYLSSCVNHDINPDVDCAETDLQIIVINTTDASGCGVSDGGINVMASGGISPYLFSIPYQFNSNGQFSNLTSGYYSVFVSDARGCSVREDNILVKANGLSFAATIIEDTDCTEGNGSIEIQVTEGNEPFSYQIGNGPFTNLNVFSSLAAGDYVVVLRDAQQCSSVLNFTIPKGNTGTGWSNTILPIIQTNCALSGCHNGVSRPDLRIYDKAKFYAAQMKKLTREGSMPFDGSITPDEIDLIGCWVDEGALNN